MGRPLDEDYTSDGLIRFMKEEFGHILDSRSEKDVEISLADAIQSAYSMFALKSPSLLSFIEEMSVHSNLKKVFQISRVPSDTQMRTILDDVSPSSFRPTFRKLFARLQRSRFLERFQVLDGHYLISGDGTGYFSSGNISCPSCMEKKSGKEILYYHQMYAASLVHPDRKEVIPFMPEPILKQDGSTKNDCERNASGRFWKEFRREHPHLKAVVIEDSLSSNAPHIELLQKLDLRYILGVKPGDHEFLFKNIEFHSEAGRVSEIRKTEGNTEKTWRFINGVPLNGSSGIKVNFLEYHEKRTGVRKGKVKEFYGTWVTDIEITETNVEEIVRCARARWKIENETFNTLKNQGYQLEHSFGHGKKNLSVVFAVIMMLAFFADQIMQIAYEKFQKAAAKCKARYRLWKKLQSVFEMVPVDSSEDLYDIILGLIKLKPEKADSS